MEKSIKKIIQGYHAFREKCALGDNSVMERLAYHGQKPEIMVIACCDSRVDPALILQCEPGDLFIVRNVANIVPPYESDDKHHGTSAALEFGICYLNVKHLIILGHSQCGGMQALFNSAELEQNDFISHWTAIANVDPTSVTDADSLGKQALLNSQQNCLTFPWIKQRIEQKKLCIHLWFFDIKSGKISNYSSTQQQYQPLTVNS
ncbi:MAG: carbonic anhydrase [Gammaproteobacteria bacterium]|nr:carbonic anhydrase [Gammaproteobacteria bacterium]